MKFDPIVTLSVSFTLLTVVVAFYMRLLVRVPYKRVIKWCKVTYSQMTPQDKIELALAAGFGIVYGIILLHL